MSKITDSRLQELLSYCDNEAANNNECRDIYVDLYEIVCTHSTTLNYAKYPRQDWVMEVGGGDTLLGYYDWVQHRVESDDE